MQLFLRLLVDIKRLDNQLKSCQPRLRLLKEFATTHKRTRNIPEVQYNALLILRIHCSRLCS
jgi:hypothetical protein